MIGMVTKISQVYYIFWLFVIICSAFLVITNKFDASRDYESYYFFVNFNKIIKDFQEFSKGWVSRDIIPPKTTNL